jgi:hypothetical protein
VVREKFTAKAQRTQSSEKKEKIMVDRFFVATLLRMTGPFLEDDISQMVLSIFFWTFALFATLR